MSAASDIYGVGLILYEMLAGRPAFDGDDFKKVARKHALERPLNPRIVNRQAKLSSELDRAVMKALEKTVKRRHESGMAFFEVLRATKEGQETWAVSAVDSSENPDDVLETQAMSSLDGSMSAEAPEEPIQTSSAESEEDIGLASTQDNLPENASQRGQTQPLSSSLTRAVLDGLSAKDSEKVESAGSDKAESDADNAVVPDESAGDVLAESVESERSETEDENGGADSLEDDEDWYADSPEQYASKTAHYDPYELEGVSRDSNLLPKIFVGVSFIAVILFLFVSNGDEPAVELDTAVDKATAATKDITANTKPTERGVKTTLPAKKPDASTPLATSATAGAEKEVDAGTEVSADGVGDVNVENNQAAEETAAEKAAAEKAAAELAAAEKAAAEKAAAEKAAAEKAAADKAAAEKAAEKAAAEKAAAAKKAAAQKKEAAKRRQERVKKAAVKSVASPTTTRKITKERRSRDTSADEATARTVEKQRREREEARKKRDERAARVKRAASALSEGSRLLKQGDHSAAKSKFNEAIKSKGLSGRALATAHAGLGGVEYELGNFSGSVREYKRSVAKVRNNAERWYLLARSYYRLGNKKDAKSSVQEALKIKPNHSKAQKLLKRVQK